MISGERSPARMSVEARRVDIVGRLLRRGISARLLVLLLPEWRALVQRVADEPCGHHLVAVRDEPER